MGENITRGKLQLKQFLFAHFHVQTLSNISLLCELHWEDTGLGAQGLPRMFPSFLVRSIFRRKNFRGQRNKKNAHFLPGVSWRENQRFGKSHFTGVKIAREKGTWSVIPLTPFLPLLGSVRFPVVNPLDAWAKGSCSNPLLNRWIFSHVFWYRSCCAEDLRRPSSSRR